MSMEQGNHDQLHALVQNAKRIAEELLIEQQERQVTDQKIDVIGTAMIQQRNNVNELSMNAQHIHEEFLLQIMRSNQQQIYIEQLIETADSRFRHLQKTHDTQRKFIESFNELQEKHQKLVKINNDNYEEYNRTLTTMIESVERLQSKLKLVDITSQTETMLAYVTDLYEHAQDYLKNRQAFRENMQIEVESLSKDLKAFNQAIQNQQEDISAVRGIVETGSDQIAALDHKFDKFIEQHNIKMRNKLTSLDDTFKKPEEKQSRGFFSKLFGGDSNE